MALVHVVELVGSSNEGWEKAVEEALNKASKKFQNIRGIDVLGLKAVVRDNKIVEYRANVKIAYVIE